MKKALILFVIFFLAFTRQSFAALGVGVGIGKIQVDQKLRPGEIYNLPPITVLNTGDQPSDYQVVIEHQEKQPQNIPQTGWFIFSPQTFHLEPKKVQTVKITLNLPVKTPPGDYFVYLEAQPVKKTATGTTSVNIAAATKLYFTVIPGSLIAGIYYKIISFWNVFFPVPQIILGLLIVGLFAVLAKRFINVEIKLSRNQIPMWAIVGSVAIFFIIYLVIWMKILGFM